MRNFGQVLVFLLATCWELGVRISIFFCKLWFSEDFGASVDVLLASFLKPGVVISIFSTWRCCAGFRVNLGVFISSILETVTSENSQHLAKNTFANSESEAMYKNVHLVDLESC